MDKQIAYHIRPFPKKIQEYNTQSTLIRKVFKKSFTVKLGYNKGITVIRYNREDLCTKLIVWDINYNFISLL